jgi:signal transduction histidine kinase/CheY-like chemotaxis protein
MLEESAQPAREANEERVLVLAPLGRDAELARAALATHGIRGDTVGNLEGLCREIERGAGAVIITEDVLTGETMGRLERVLGAQPAWSDLPFIVFVTAAESATGVHKALPRVEPLGNATILERPVRVHILLVAVKAALRARKRQLGVRSLLADLESGVHQRDQFLAMLGHELRNPIAAVTYALDLLDRDRSSEARERHRDAIRRQTTHLARLVDDLLDVARVTSGKLVLSRRPLDLGELVRRCAQAIEPSMRSQGLDLRAHVDPSSLMICGDSVRLEQVVTNLLTNAAKYTPAGGHVFVGVERDESDALVRVEDDGIGIAPAMLPRIFELFTQVDQALDRARGGMGIGLTLVRRLAELHGGSVTADSRGEGQGSTFVVRLPLDDAAARPPDDHAAEPAPRSRRVLLVEDNDDIRESFEELLEACGHVVYTAVDGPSGVALALSSRPELALVDIGLPVMNGYEVARAIRASLGDEVVLAALTGYGQPEDRARALAAGFDVHLTKPVSLDAVNALFRAR